MKTNRVTWTDSITPGVLGTKVYRDDVEIADVGFGIETFDDVNASEGETYKYEVQAYTSSGESEQELTDINVKFYDTPTDGLIIPTGINLTEL